MRCSIFLLCGFCLVPWVSMAAAAETITVPNCLIALDEEVHVPAQEAGVLTELPVRLGQQVKKGDKLAQIDDLIPQAQVNVAKNKLAAAQKEADSDIGVRYAKAAYNHSIAELEVSKDANQKVAGSVTAVRMDELRLKCIETSLSIEKTQKDLDVAGCQAKVAEAELASADANRAHRCILSMLDGVAVRVERHVGEWVAAGDPLVHIVRMDRLRIEGSVDPNECLPSEIHGQPVRITVRLPRGETETFPGKLTFVSPVVLGNEFRVVAEVENRQKNGFWILRPGLHADMTIQLK